MSTPKPTEHPWPEYVEPPKDQWVDWFMQQTPEWQRHYLTEQGWEVIRRGSRCELAQHDALALHLREERIRADDNYRSSERHRLAWRSARQRANRLQHEYRRATGMPSRFPFFSREQLQFIRSITPEQVAAMKPLAYLMGWIVGALKPLATDVQESTVMVAWNAATDAWRQEHG